MQIDFSGAFDDVYSGLSTETPCLSSTSTAETPSAIQQTPQFDTTQSPLMLTEVDVADFDACFGVVSWLYFYNSGIILNSKDRDLDILVCATT